MFSVTRKSIQLFSTCLSTRSLSLSKKCHQSRALSNLNFRIYTSNRFFSDEKNDEKSAITVRTFENAEKKEKETYLECLRKYEGQTGRKVDCVPFLYIALKYMDEFGVNKDLECYKQLLNCFPKGKMIPLNKIQAEFMHYPKEQKCATTILQKMEDNKVIGDIEVERILRNIFGGDSVPLQKFWRMMYWMPKFKNLSPWPLPKPLPNDSLELAKLAIWKITTVDPQAKITVFQTDTVKDSIDKTWIVSAITPKQKELLENHSPRTKALYVEGPFTTWVAEQSVDYFVLLTKISEEERIKIKIPDLDDVSNLDVSYWNVKKTTIVPFPSVHEQIHETIFSVCATGTSSKDSLLSWIRCLQNENPILSELHIIFTLRKETGKDVKLLGEELTVKGIEDHQTEIDKR